MNSNLAKLQNLIAKLQFDNKILKAHNNILDSKMAQVVKPGVRPTDHFLFSESK